MGPFYIVLYARDPYWYLYWLSVTFNIILVQFSIVPYSLNVTVMIFSPSSFMMLISLLQLSLKKNPNTYIYTHVYVLYIYVCKILCTCRSRQFFLCICWTVLPKKQILLRWQFCFLQFLKRETRLKKKPKQTKKSNKDRENITDLYFWDIEPKYCNHLGGSLAADLPVET